MPPVVFQIAPFFRSFGLDRAAVDADSRTVPLSFSSETPVRRTIPKDFPDKAIAGRSVNEVLSHEDGACDLSRLRALCVEHDLKRQVGAVADVKIDAKRGQALARFSRGAAGEQELQDVLDGIRSDVSVGYKIQAYRLEPGATRDEPPTLRVTRWQPFEVSLVTLGADGTVGLGRAVDTSEITDCTAERSADFHIHTTPTIIMTVEEQAAADKKLRDESRKSELKRQSEIRAVGERFGRNSEITALVTRSLEDGMDADEFKRAAFELIAGETAKPLNLDPNLGMNPKEKARYSLVRAARMIAERRPLDGLELECSRAMEKIIGSAPEGFFVPNDIAAAGRSDMEGYRALNVSSATQGGNTIQTDVLGGSMIELLRNKQTIRRLGARSLDGLVGNVAIPRQTGAATGYSVSEQGAITGSTQAIGQLALTPKRIGAFNDYSKQLLAQSSIDVENFIRMDLMNVLAILSDYLAINGTGSSNQPTGILSTAGIGAVTFGAAATWAKILDFETQVANANADSGSLAYLTTPSARAKMKANTKVASSQYSNFIWEAGAAPGEGIINSYMALATKQVAADAMIFGNFADLILAGWAGLDVVVDPYSQATAGTVRITVNQFMDIGVRHAGSFVASTDSAAQ